MQWGQKEMYPANDFYSEAAVMNYTWSNWEPHNPPPQFKLNVSPVHLFADIPSGPLWLSIFKRGEKIRERGNGNRCFYKGKIFCRFDETTHIWVLITK